jgi:hypothetical protein
MRFSEMSNEEVLAVLKSFVGEGNRIVAKVIATLAEVEERRMYLELACSSMFVFCVKKLGFSEGEAFRRITAARLVRRFPAILDAIASGRVHLSTVVLLRDHFSDENVEALLGQAAGKSKREVEELVATLAPKADVPSLIRKLPERVVIANPALPQAPPATTPTPRPKVEPLSESRYKVQLTASAPLRDKLEHARSLMSHRNPSGDLAVIVEQALDLLIESIAARTTSTQPSKCSVAPTSINRSTCAGRSVEPVHRAPSSGTVCAPRSGEWASAAPKRSAPSRHSTRKAGAIVRSSCSYVTPSARSRKRLKLATEPLHRRETATAIARLRASTERARARTLAKDVRGLLSSRELGHRP